MENGKPTPMEDLIVNSSYDIVGWMPFADRESRHDIKAYGTTGFAGGRHGCALGSESAGRVPDK